MAQCLHYRYQQINPKTNFMTNRVLQEDHVRLALKEKASELNALLQEAGVAGITVVIKLDTEMGSNSNVAATKAIMAITYPKLAA